MVFLLVITSAPAVGELCELAPDLEKAVFELDHLLEARVVVGTDAVLHRVEATLELFLFDGEQ